MITSEALAVGLVRHGVKLTFSQCFPVRTQHVAPKYGIRQIGFRTENAGGYMADGYARVSRHFAVVAAQSGPAATLLVPPLAEAFKASVPILALIEESARAEADRNAFQEFDHIALFSSCSKWTRRVDRPDRFDDYLDMAIVQATRSHPALALGVSPRGSLALVQSARALALVDGRRYCIPDDLKELAVPACAHRIIPRDRWEGAVESTADPERIIREIVQEIAVPR